MTITTYAELQTTIGDFLNRTDLTSVIPTFIQLAEADMNRKLRHWRMENRAAGTLDTRYSALPTDWLETIRFNISTANGTTRLELMSQSEMADMRLRQSDTAGTPYGYALTAGEIEVYPTPDASYDMELNYYSRIDALSDSNTSNWVLEYYPDAYLYGSLVHSAPYLSDDTRAAVWASFAAAAFDGINAENEASRWSGSGLKMRQDDFS